MKELPNKYITTRRFTIGITETKDFLRNREISC